MLILGGLRASAFEGLNVTEFIERYKELYEDFKLLKRERIKRLPCYCEITIR
jgi:hypothetical protein